MILSKKQAKAIYGAVRALGDVGGEFDTFALPCGIKFMTFSGGGGYGISVGGRIREEYESQNAFATAYGLA
jgi:hypothetical protein